MFLHEHDYGYDRTQATTFLAHSMSFALDASKICFPFSFYVSANITNDSMINYYTEKTEAKDRADLLRSNVLLTAVYRETCVGQINSVKFNYCHFISFHSIMLIPLN